MTSDISKTVTGSEKLASTLIQIGIFLWPKLLRKQLDLREQQFDKMVELVEKYPHLKSSIKWDGMEVISLDQDSKPVDLSIRSKMMSESIQMQRQFNLENTLDRASEILESEDKIPIEPVEADKASRIIDYIKDVSDEEMQKLWAQLLAGEIKRPGSFSLRTINLLRNLSKTEASIINEIFEYVISNVHTDITFIPKEIHEYVEKFHRDHSHFLLLKELGIFYPALTLHHLYDTNQESISVFTSGKIFMKVTKKAKSGALSSEVYSLSSIGKDFLKLTNHGGNKPYLQKWAEYLEKNKLMKVEYSRLLYRDKKNVNYEHPMKRLTDNEINW